jgi:hypothetical protein
MKKAARDSARLRANDRCEYCLISQAVEPALLFHVEHIIARQHGGSDDISNLALSCPSCNLHKGSNLSGVDPDTPSRGMNALERLETLHSCALTVHAAADPLSVRLGYAGVADSEFVAVGVEVLVEIVRAWQSDGSERWGA